MPGNTQNGSVQALCEMKQISMVDWKNTRASKVCKKGKGKDGTTGTRKEGRLNSSAPGTA